MSKDILKIPTAGATAFATTLLFSSAVSAATASFTDAMDLGVGINTYSAAAADFMGNGRPDIVTADGTLWINTSPGDGSTSFVQGPAVQNALWVTAADMNGDGKPDLIEIDGSNQIYIFLNITQPGDTVPSFAAPVVFDAGNGLGMVVAADVNGDGLPDLIVTDTGASAVDVLINTTTAGNPLSFSNFQAYPAGTAITSVTVGDVNGDGLNDIVAVNEIDNTVSVYINTTTTIGTPTASFTNQQVFAVGNLPTMAVIADINGDGKGDIVVANNNLNAISVLLSTMTTASSTAAFSPEQDFATGNVPNWVAVTDVDGDGKPDLVAANSADNTISVIFNTTPTNQLNASFDQQQVIQVGSDPENIAVADLNGDGKLDLAVLNTAGPGGSPTVSALINGSN